MSNPTDALPTGAGPATPVAPGPSGSRWLALTAMMFAVSMMFIDQTIVSIAVPTIQQELDLSEGGVQWIINGYLLALSAFFALGGRLSDILGHKRMVLIGTVMFAVSSALCGATPAAGYAEAWLITFRIVQGIGAALLFPAALAVVVAVFPLRERGRALALFFGVTGGLTAIGPILGGYLSQWTWRAIFWVNVPVAIIAVTLTLLARVHTKHTNARIDYLGAVLIATGMGLSVLGLQQAGAWGWTNARTWLCISLGLILLAVFVKVETRVAEPLIKVRIFRDRAFSVDNAVLFFAMMAFVPVFFFGSVYAQISLGFSASDAGLYLLVFFAGFAPAAQIGGRILDRSGARMPVTIGCAIAAVGFFWWGTKVTDLDGGLASQWIFIVIGGAGIGLLLGPASTDAVNRSINASYGEVTGVTQTIRNYGSSLGLAILGSLLININTRNVVATLVGVGVPQATAESTAASMGQGGSGANFPPGTPQAVVDTVTRGIAQDYAQATQVVLWGMAVALVIAFVISLLHPGDRVTQEVVELPVPQDSPGPHS